MHIHKLEEWQHQHQFNMENVQGERNTWKVIVLTFLMMVVEIITGMLFGSMALLADGFHMATHTFALGITVIAYYYSRKHAHDPRYSFGTGKIGVLGGFTSAIFLAMVSFAMIFESIVRLSTPRAIQFNEAILVAVIGLIVNLVSAYLLHGHDVGHHHSEHEHDNHQHNDHHDHNLRAAYLHVIADALTSVLAIIALLAGKYFGWIWMDPLMGIVGAIVILKWAYGLVTQTGKILLDHNVDNDFMTKIKNILESDSDTRISDIHAWKLSSQKYAAIIAIVTHYPKPPDYYKSLLEPLTDIAHLTVEVHTCKEEPCLPQPQ
jgi:cation diffusion facilitator family transporter